MKPFNDLFPHYTYEAHGDVRAIHFKNCVIGSVTKVAENNWIAVYSENNRTVSTSRLNNPTSAFCHIVSLHNPGEAQLA